MEFKIPKKYTVGGQDVVVEIVETDGGDYGNYNNCKGVMKICENVMMYHSQKLPNLIHSSMNSHIQY